MTGTGRLAGRGCLIVGGTGGGGPSAAPPGPGRGGGGGVPGGPPGEGGIGLATARRFLAEGAGVVVAGDRPEMGDYARGQLEPLGLVWAATADIRSTAEVDALFAFALDALGGRLDVLFHVAGISGRRF